VRAANMESRAVAWPDESHADSGEREDAADQVAAIEAQTVEHGSPPLAETDEDAAVHGIQPSEV